MVDASLSIEGAAADAKATGDAIANVNGRLQQQGAAIGDLSELETEDKADLVSAINEAISGGKTVVTYYTLPLIYDSITTYTYNFIAGKVFKSDRVIPAGVDIDSVTLVCKQACSGAICFINSETDEVVYVKSVSCSQGANIVTINEHFNAGVSLATYNIICGFLSQDNYNSEYGWNLGYGLYEADTSAVPTVGSTIAFQHNSTTRAYSASIQWSYHITKIGSTERMIAEVEGGSTATAGYAVGEYIIHNGSLYKVIADIETGDTFGSDNLEEVTVMSEVSRIYVSLKNGGEGKALALATQKWLPVGVQFKGKTLRYVETPNDVEFIGRWYDKTVNGRDCKVTNNAGSSLYFKTSGASTVTLEWIPVSDTHVHWSYSIDGGTFTRASIDITTITLPDTGEHIIRVIADGIKERIGKWENGTGFTLASISVNAGKLTGIYPMNPQIMFIGDSIVEGVLSLGTSDNSYGDMNSATGSFSWFCSENLHAVPFFVGYGASGVLTTGSFNTAINAVKFLYSGVPVPTYYPDIIVIEHGVNDTQTGSTFRTAYAALLDAISIKYPGVPVYLLIPFNQSHAADIRTIANTYTWCTLIETVGWYSGTLHPLAADAEIIGQHLADTLKSEIYGLPLSE